MHQIRETRPLHRDSDNVKRRWFSNDYFDIIVWLDNSEEISGFQLCYDKNKKERALTWRPDKGFSHCGVDTGELNPTKNRAPMLIPDGIFPADIVFSQFAASSKLMDPLIVQFINDKIAEYISINNV
jgi:hypothetical protein